MELKDVRRKIDEIDPQIRDLLMKRLDCSRLVAEAKKEAGSTDIYRADREEAILKRLGEGIPEDRKKGYLAVVRKIMETSRMYQYGLLFDWDPSVFDRIDRNPSVDPERPTTAVTISVVRPNQPNAMSSILSMIGDYGYNMERMTLLMEETDKVHFELTILGNLAGTEFKKLMFQLSKECLEFRIVKTE